MRTRGKSKRETQSSGIHDDKMKPKHESESGSPLEALDQSVSANGKSRQGVDKVLCSVNARRSSGKKKQAVNIQHCDSVNTPESGSRRNGKQAVDTKVTGFASEVGGCSKDADSLSCSGDEMGDSDWEECPIPKLDTVVSHPNAFSNELTIEFSQPIESPSKKTARRASAEEKELAELVHKVHLLCLLARGRIIDATCDDPLIQASLLSLLPSHLLKISELPKLTAKGLAPLISWFQTNFRVRSSANVERSFRFALACALESREGTYEEVAALSVALFRALNLTTRFVSIMDAASLKPNDEKHDSSIQNGRKSSPGIFNTSTLMVSKQKEVSGSPAKPIQCNEDKNICKTTSGGSRKRKVGKLSNNKAQAKDSSVSDELKDSMVDSLSSEAQNGSEACKSESLRKGDIEYKMQLEMALSATAVGTSKCGMRADAKVVSGSSSKISPYKRIKRIQSIDSSTSCQVISTAVGSRKVGSPLYWAEVYCNAENLAGKWVHVDAVNSIIDGEEQVEAAAAACKTSLRYVVAFAGGGAKDVTRRYCMKWHKIASKRVESLWWDAVLAPLRQLESGATGGVVHLEKQHPDVQIENDNTQTSRGTDNAVQDESAKHTNSPNDVESSQRSLFLASRSSLEDMELETRALTEPLPTNQQDYRNHKLYAIERWLTKYQVLHPKGPVLGFCSGHPVYPRTCVHTLKRKERWLREGLQVKGNELPAKVLKQSSKLKKTQALEADEHDEDSSGGTIDLYGQWQLEPLCLPHAENGIVPKNERGQVEVWSEKCLPPGTVHLRFPRIFHVAKRLEIDYAPAMVGFEFKNGHSTPVFDGIVVCSEFKDAILEAYAEEVERRESEEKKRNEGQAISRWYQLLSSIVTRQKLNNRYVEGVSSHTSSDIRTVNDNAKNRVGGGGGSKEDKESHEVKRRNKQVAKWKNLSVGVSEEHEHVFLKEDESFDEESSITTKRCQCGFSVQMEEL